MKLIDQETYDIIVDALKLIVDREGDIFDPDTGTCTECYCKTPWEHEDDCIITEVKNLYDEFSL